MRFCDIKFFDPHDLSLSTSTKYNKKIALLTAESSTHVLPILLARAAASPLLSLYNPVAHAARALVKPT